MSGFSFEHVNAASESAHEVGLKMTFVRDGEVAEVRRTRLANPSFVAVKAVVERWARGSYTLQYTDDEGDAVSMDSQEEWAECLSQLKGADPLKLRVQLSAVRAAGTAEAEAEAEARPWGRGRCRPGMGKPWMPWMSMPMPWMRAQWHCGRRGFGEWAKGGEKEEGEGDDGGASTAAQVAVARRVLEKLHGEEVMPALGAGEVDAAALGCQRWLEVRQVAAGEVDLDIKVRALGRTLHRLGMEALDRQGAGSTDAEEWFQLETELLPQAPIGWYNLACAIVAAGREGMQERACDALERAVSAGYRRFRHAERDADLAPLKDLPRFQDLLSRMREHRARDGPRCVQKPFVAPEAGGMACNWQLELQRARRARLDGDEEQRGSAAAKCGGCDFAVTGLAAEACCKKCAKHPGRHGPRCIKKPFVAPEAGGMACNWKIELRRARRARLDGDEEQQESSAAKCGGCDFAVTGLAAEACCKKCAKHPGRHGPRCVQKPFTAPEAQAAEAVPAANPAAPEQVQAPTPEQPQEEAQVKEQREQPQEQEQEPEQAQEVDPAVLYEVEATTLKAMGFPVTAGVLALLQASNGDLERVLNEELLC